MDDAVSREKNVLIGKAKDVAAGSVLLATASATIGLIVFLPHLISRFAAPSFD